MFTYEDHRLLQQKVIQQKRAGKRIGFVPTMGSLHAGHMSLMKIAKERCDFLVVSIYVNPLQFGANEDLDAYPSDPKGDAEKCRSIGADALFMPKSLYSDNHATAVNVKGLSEGLCGASRPGHFQGVTTVVARLFGMIQPDLAVFGEKDFQQLAVIKRMVDDLAMPIEIIGGPLVRDEDGVALSSRNTYLNHEERTKAQSIVHTLNILKEAVAESAEPLDAHALRKKARDTLLVDELDYLEFVDPINLIGLREINGPARALIAAWVGSTRLIDNMDISKP